MDSDDFVLRKKGMTVKVFNNNIDGAIIQLKRRMNSEGINKELRSVSITLRQVLFVDRS